MFWFISCLSYAVLSFLYSLFSSLIVRFPLLSLPSVSLSVCLDLCLCESLCLVSSFGAHVPLLVCHPMFPQPVMSVSSHFPPLPCQARVSFAFLYFLFYCESLASLVPVCFSVCLGSGIPVYFHFVSPARQQ